MLQRWLDRDDITADDLDEMTAEEEVLDWMIGSPLPARRRPDWLPEEAWEATQERAPIGPAMAAPPVWPLVLVVAIGLLTAAAVVSGCMVMLAALVWAL